MAIDEKAARPLGDLLQAGDSVEQLYEEVRAAFEAERGAAASADQVRTLRDRWLGRKNGLLTALNDNWLKSVPREYKPAVGKLQNRTKKAVEAAVKAAEASARTGAAKKDLLDVTLPGPARSIGARHPVRLVLEETIDIFKGLGYSCAEGPEIETFFYNFEALNFPPDHTRGGRDGHVVPRRPRAAADAHFAESDPHHGVADAAVAVRRLRQGLSQRHAGCDP